MNFFELEVPAGVDFEVLFFGSTPSAADDVDEYCGLPFAGATL